MIYARLILGFAACIGLVLVFVLALAKLEDHQPEYPEANEDHEWFFEELLKEKREGEA